MIYRVKKDIDNSVRPDISAEERRILELLKIKGGDKDSITAATGLQPSKIAAALTMLEIKGIIQQVGGIYLLI